MREPGAGEGCGTRMGVAIGHIHVSSCFDIGRDVLGVIPGLGGIVPQEGCTRRGEVIDENEVPGLLVATNLIRTLNPLSAILREIVQLGWIKPLVPSSYLADRRKPSG